MRDNHSVGAYLFWLVLSATQAFSRAIGYSSDWFSSGLLVLLFSSQNSSLHHVGLNGRLASVGSCFLRPL